MPLDNRELRIGTRLAATYKKETYVCTVEGGGETEKKEFVLEDGRRFASPSGAASALMGGRAVNGWLFWSLEDTGGEETRAGSPSVQ